MKKLRISCVRCYKTFYNSYKYFTLQASSFVTSNHSHPPRIFVGKVMKVDSHKVLYLGGIQPCQQIQISLQLADRDELNSLQCCSIKCPFMKIYYVYTQRLLALSNFNVLGVGVIINKISYDLLTMKIMILWSNWQNVCKQGLLKGEVSLYC